METRPQAYNYLRHLENHMQLDQAFGDEIIYPRQLQLYMPGECNFGCYYCAGRLSNTKSVHWEETGLELLDKLGDRIPYHQYTGCSTEPTLNPYFMRFLETTKRNGCHFGIKTNGSKLAELEDDEGFLTKLCDISTDSQDYISISLDAGDIRSHIKTKKSTRDIFNGILRGMHSLCRIRGDRDYPAIRVSYLLNEWNDSEQEALGAITMARSAGVDSIRFSQPHPAYLEDSEIARKWWREIKQKDGGYRKLFDELSSIDRITIFYDSPAEISEVRLNRCAYGYYQITISQDGFLYRCTTVVGVPDMRIGSISSDLNEFEDAIKLNQDEAFNPGDCLNKGAYCCRAAMAINTYYETEHRKFD